MLGMKGRGRVTAGQSDQQQSDEQTGHLSRESLLRGIKNRESFFVGPPPHLDTIRTIYLRYIETPRKMLFLFGHGHNILVIFITILNLRRQFHQVGRRRKDANDHHPRVTHSSAHTAPFADVVIMNISSTTRTMQQSQR